MKDTIFSVPGNVSINQIERFLKQSLELQLQKPVVLKRTYLDTFDWRVFSENTVLELKKDSAGNWLTWRSLGGKQVFAKSPIRRRPRFAHDLKGLASRPKLKKMLGVRALLPVATVYTHSRTGYVKDDKGRILLHIELQTDHPGSKVSTQTYNRSSTICKRIHIFPLKGQANLAKKATHLLEKDYQLSRLADDQFRIALDYFGKSPDGQRHVQLVDDPGLRTDEAVKRVFYQLLESMKVNESGIKKDIDTEFLHDFRVAVRRSRALLTQVKNVLPGPRIERFKKEFAWLGEITGPTRDMDVYLLSFDKYRKSLPVEQRDDLLPLYAFLQRNRLKKYCALVKTLNSVRYKKLKRDWETFLLGPVPKFTTLKNAKMPIVDYASKRIWRVFKKSCKQGDAINADSAAENLHELRKTCKTLRYLSEFFQALYPENVMQKSIKNLKDLQNNLGDFQDLQVQQDALQNFMVEMESETGVAGDTRLAIETLVTILAQRNLAVRQAFDGKFRIFSSKSNRVRYKSCLNFA